MATQPLLVTGLQGLVGSKLASDFAENYSFESLDVHDPVTPVDITDAAAVQKAFEQSSARAVVHFAAFTDVNAAFAQQGDTNGVAYKVNVVGTENIVKAAESTGKHLVHISTSYVFDGEKTEQYVETDTPHAIEWYGQTKLEAEEKVKASSAPWTILRIDQPFRSDTYSRPDVIRKMVGKIKDGSNPAFFADHYIGPTFIDDFVKVIDWSIRTQTTGLFHATSGESWTDYELAQAICEVHHLEPRFTAGSLAEYLKTTSRPYQKNTALNCELLKSHLDFQLRSIKEALALVNLD